MSLKSPENCKFCRGGNDEKRSVDQAPPGGGCGIGAELAEDELTEAALLIGIAIFDTTLPSFSLSTRRRGAKGCEGVFAQYEGM